MLGGQIRIWHLVKVRVCIVGVSRDETVFRPADNSRFMDVEASSRFRCRQHAAVAKSVVARAKCVSMDEIDDARSEEHTSELQSRLHLVCRLLLEKKKIFVTPHNCQYEPVFMSRAYL